MRILIANPFGIGDVLFTRPLLQALQSQLPDPFFGYLCNRRTLEMVAGWPEIQWAQPFELRAIAKRSRLQGGREFLRTVRELQDGRFDLLIDLSLGPWVSAAGFLAGIRRRMGLDYRGRGRFLTDRIPFSGFFMQSVPDYYLDLLPKLGLERPREAELRMPLPSEGKQSAEQLLSRWGITEKDRLLGIVPGGGASWGPAARFKQWAPDRFAETAETLADRHGLQIVLFGDAEDEPACREIQQHVRRPVHRALPAPSLPALAHLLSRCALVIGNDSGPLHLAEAVGTRNVAIFGPVDASVYGPPEGSRSVRRRIAARGLACRPCYRNFRFPPCPWDNACLKELQPARVIELAEQFLNS